MLDAVAVVRELEAERCSRRLQVLRFQRANPVRAYVVLTDGAPLVIDSGVVAGRDGFLEHLRELPQAPGLLVLTHGHGDHLGCAAAVVEAFGCPVACHDDEVPRLEQTGLTVGRTFHDKEVLAEGIRVLHTPGHANGNCALLLEPERVLLVGDTLFGAGSPGGDWPVNPPPDAYSADPAAARRSIRRLLDLDFDACIMGHGEPVLADARARVAELVKMLEA